MTMNDWGPVSSRQRCVWRLEAWNQGKASLGSWETDDTIGYTYRLLWGLLSLVQSCYNWQFVKLQLTFNDHIHTLYVHSSANKREKLTNKSNILNIFTPHCRWQQIRSKLHIFIQCNRDVGQRTGGCCDSFSYSR